MPLEPVKGRRVQVGADRYMQRLGIDTGDFAAEAARLADEEHSGLGHTPSLAMWSAVRPCFPPIAMPARQLP